MGYVSSLEGNASSYKLKTPTFVGFLKVTRGAQLRDLWSRDRWVHPDEAKFGQMATRNPGAHHQLIYGDSIHGIFMQVNPANFKILVVRISSTKPP